MTTAIPRPGLESPSVQEETKAQLAPGWEDAERAARLAARVPAETGIEAGDLLELCLASADPDGALAGAVRALAERKQRYGRPAPRTALAPVVRVSAASKFLAQALAARPRLVDLLACPRFAAQPRSAQDAQELARRRTARAT